MLLLDTHYNTDLLTRIRKATIISCMNIFILFTASTDQSVNTSRCLVILFVHGVLITVTRLYYKKQLCIQIQRVWLAAPDTDSCVTCKQKPQK